MNISRIRVQEPLFNISYRRQSCSPFRPCVCTDRIVFAVIEESGIYRPVFGAEILDKLKPGTKIPAAVIPSEYSKRDLFQIFIMFEMSVRELNSVEKCRALKYAVDAWGKGEWAGTVMQCLGLPNSCHTLDLHLAVLELEDAWHERIASGYVSVKTGSAVLLFSSEDRKILLDIFSSVYFTSRMQDIFIGYIRDIMKLRKCGMNILVGEWGFDSLNRAEDVTEKQKGKILLGRAHSALYPDLEKDREDFGILTEQLGFERDIECRPHPFFEKKDIRFSFSASSLEEFREKADRLKRAAKKDDAGKLFEF